MTTEINKNLDQYCGKNGFEYQITVKKEHGGQNNIFSWITLTEKELNELVQEYMKFKLGE